MTTTTTTSSNYIDLHTTGIGYLSRVSEVIPKGRKRDTFTRCTINAMHGDKEELKYTRFDVVARSEQALGVLQQFQDHANDQNLQLMVQFKIGDIVPTSFMQTQGKNAGQLQLTLQGRLLLINRVWIKNKTTGERTLAYKLPEKEVAEEPAAA